MSLLASNLSTARNSSNFEALKRGGDREDKVRRNCRSFSLHLDQIPNSRRYRRNASAHSHRPLQLSPRDVRVNVPRYLARRSDVSGGLLRREQRRNRRRKFAVGRFFEARAQASITVAVAFPPPVRFLSKRLRCSQAILSRA